MKKLNIKREAQGDSFIYKLIDSKKFQKNLLDKELYDEQTKKLARDIFTYFMEKFDLSRDEREAFNRLTMSIERGSSFNGGMHRNIIFKAAHALGMKLPSSMF